MRKWLVPALVSVGFAVLGAAVFPVLVLDAESPNYNTFVVEGKIVFSEPGVDGQIFADAEWWIFDKTERLGVLQNLANVATPFPKVQGTPRTVRGNDTISVSWVLQAGTTSEGAQAFSERLREFATEREIRAFLPEVESLIFFPPEYQDLTPTEKALTLANVRDIPDIRPKMAVVGGLSGVFAFWIAWTLKDFLLTLTFSELHSGVVTQVVPDE